MTIRNAFGIALSGLLLVGCGTVDEPVATVGNSIKVSSTTTSSSGSVPGYVHGLSVSKFRIGDSVWEETNLPQIQRWRGTLGAFATDPTNGWSMAEINSDTSRGPYITDDATQNGLVVEYLTTAGLPSDQIGKVGDTYVITGGGDLTAAPTSTAFPPLTSVNTVIGRRVNGVDVPDSYAWVKMTTSGQVDGEAVYWPPIDINVVKAAVALKQQLTDATAHAAFAAKLPGHVYRDVGVVIRHSSHAVHSTPTAYVSYDAVVDEASTANARHFDQNGVEFLLPQENLPHTPTPRPMPTQ